MIITAKMEFKSALRVDADFLTELNEIIMTYFDKIKYKAKLRNGDEVEFSSVTELIDYDNYDLKSIKSLHISFGYPNSMSIDSWPGKYARYGSTVRVEFEYDNADKCEEIKRKIKEVLNRHKQSIFYTALSKFSFFHILLLAAIYTGVFFTNVILAGTSLQVNSNENVFVMVVISCFFVISGYLLVDGLFGKLFPEIVFYLGSDKKRIDRFTDIKSKVFWGIIVAVVVGIIINMISG